MGTRVKPTLAELAKQYVREDLELLKDDGHSDFAEFLYEYDPEYNRLRNSSSDDDLPIDERLEDFGRLVRLAADKALESL